MPLFDSHPTIPLTEPYFILFPTQFLMKSLGVENYPCYDSTVFQPLFTYQSTDKV